MPVDPSIALQYQRPKFMTPADAISLQSLVQQTQAQKFQMAQMQRAEQERQGILSVMSRPNATDDKGMVTLETIRDLYRISPDYGQKAAGQREHMMQQQVEMQRAKTLDESARITMEKHLRENMDRIASETVAEVDQKGKDLPPDQKQRMTREVYQRNLDEWEKSGTANLPDPWKANLRKAPITYEELKAKALGTKGLSEQESKAERDRLAAERMASQIATSTERLGLERERLDLAKQKLEQQQTRKSALAQRFTNRMAIAANEAIADLNNVVQLPVTVSGGVFAGRHQGPGLLAATKEVLANKMTTEEVQMYNVFTAGIQRNLAAIEATGLMPSGKLSDMMNAVVLKEGDTNLVKIAKLAQTRQIIENGLEPLLNDPEVPDQQKTFISSMIEKARKAVPFTQQDVVRVMTGPRGETLGAHGKRVTGTGKPAAPSRPTPQSGPYDDPEKERRYQEWKRQHAQPQ